MSDIEDAGSFPVDLSQQDGLIPLPIATIPKGAFVENPQLEKVELLSTTTTSIEPGAFEGLPEGFFVGFPQLKTLTLQKNKLTSLPPVLDADLFEKLASVVTLRLAHNDLHTLPEDIFDPLLKLKKLYLSDNPWRCDCNLIPLHLWIKANSDKIQSAAVCDHNNTNNYDSANNYTHNHYNNNPTQDNHTHNHYYDSYFDNCTYDHNHFNDNCTYFHDNNHTHNHHYDKHFSTHHHHHNNYMRIYTTLLVVVITCTLVLARFTLSLCRLLQRRESKNQRVELTRFSYRREVILGPLHKAATG
ncbi:hypothetical protein NQZ68_029490 [Dissostichus eleginoides]|nr:hypothetical protein NQZ68_029490 [Dissostichus eleginoides]